MVPAGPRAKVRSCPGHLLISLHLKKTSTSALTETINAERQAGNPWGTQSVLSADKSSVVPWCSITPEGTSHRGGIS